MLFGIEQILDGGDRLLFFDEPERACPMNLRLSLWMTGVKPVTQETRKQPVIAIPVAIAVERNQKQIRTFEVVEDFAAVAASRNGIAEVSRELRQRAGFEQKGTAGIALPREDFLGKKLGELDMGAYSYNRAKEVPVHSLAALLDTSHPYSLAEVGATIEATPVDVFEIAGINRNVRGADDRTWGIQAGYDHSLSKRTSLYARAGYMRNHGEATMSWPGVSVKAPGTSQTLALIGMTHRF
ncbi:porin [Paraburkholderia sp. SIMBA_049]